jgi:hypothetical protein
MKQQRFPKMRPLILLLAVCVFGSLCLCSCSNRLTQENFDKVRTGMSEAEVKAILGEPTEAKSVDIGIFSGTTSTWKGKGVTITIQFVNGKVMLKEFSKPGLSSSRPDK